MAEAQDLQLQAHGRRSAAWFQKPSCQRSEIRQQKAAQSHGTHARREEWGQGEVQQPGMSMVVKLSLQDAEWSL